MVPNLGIFIISRYFAIRQIPVQKYPNYTFLVTNLEILFFAKSAIRQIWGCWFQIWQQFFQIPAQKYQNKTFFCPKVKDFYFCTKLCSKTNSRTLIWNMTIVLSNSSPKIRKLGIFGPKFKDFYFAPNFTIRQIWGGWFQIWQ